MELSWQVTPNKNDPALVKYTLNLKDDDPMIQKLFNRR